MDAGKTEYRFLWVIKNYTHLQARYRWLDSSEFRVERASWSLNLYQDLLVTPSKEDSIFLLRSKDDEGPEKIGMKFEITLSTVDGTTLYSKACGDAELNFERGTSHSVRAFVYKDKSRFGRNDVFLPKDTLCVMCRMWRGEGTVEKVSQITALSRVLFEKISFLLKVENFSTRKINKVSTLKTIASVSETGCGISAFLEIKKVSDSGETLIVQLEPSKNRYYLCDEKFSLIDASGNTVEFSGGRNRKEDLPKLTRKYILDNKRDYLPNDELTLMCELLLYAREKLIVDSIYDVPMAIYVAKYRDAHSTEEASNSFIDYFKTLSL